MSGGLFSGLKRDAACGFLSVDPIPSSKEVQEYYEQEYYEDVVDGACAPDLEDLIQSIQNESEWRVNTWYDDILSLIAKPQTLLDVGCGTGQFMNFAQGRDIDAIGIEPAKDMRRILQDRGFDIHPSIEHYTTSCGKSVDCVTMLNVLEHVRNPRETLRSVFELLASDDDIMLKVPNDFNPLQIAAHSQLEVGRYWFSPGVHLHYFNFDSLRCLLKEVGFTVRHSFASFPMELFLLLGYDYSSDPQLGKELHRRRCQFDTNIPADVRRGLYKQLAESSIGRSCTVIGTKCTYT